MSVVHVAVNGRQAAFCSLVMQTTMTYIIMTRLDLQNDGIYCGIGSVM